ncbi:hypothetical protein PLCT2_01052 [Planctomycetaceae bacterium]|nr:hypothetical protein PLCT2_01052 [Planctomycetaceae bacterium]
MPNQQPGYPSQGYPQQQYSPQQGGYGQPQYPQKKGSSGIMKGCIIAFVIIFIVGGGLLALGVGAAWFGISKVSEMTGKEVDGAVATSDNFMKKLAAGDVKGAHALCDSTITEAQLTDFYKAYEKVLKDNKGLKYNTVEIMGIQVRGNVNVHNDDAYVTLQPADVNGQADLKVALQLHRAPGSSEYKVQYFGITGFMPTENAGPLGDMHQPTHRSSNGRD